MLPRRWEIQLSQPKKILCPAISSISPLLEPSGPACHDASMSEEPLPSAIPVARTDAALIALRRILRATEQHERELAQAAGLTPAKLRVLQILAGNEGRRATPTRLAGQMGVSQATVTALVDQLEKRGLTQRERSDTDRRQLLVNLTEAGAQALSDAPDALQQHFVQGFTALQDWEQAMLVAALERVAAMLNAAGIDASPVLTLGEIGRPKT